MVQKLKVKRPEILDALLDVGLSVKELVYKNGSYSIKGKRSKAVIGNKGDVLVSMIQAKGNLVEDKAVSEAIGRLKERYPRVARYYKLKCDTQRKTLTCKLD